MMCTDYRWVDEVKELQRENKKLKKEGTRLKSMVKKLETELEGYRARARRRKKQLEEFGEQFNASLKRDSEAYEQMRNAPQ